MKSSLLLLKIYIITTISTPNIDATLSKENENNERREKQVCLTPDCVLAAARILESTDFSINPCDDFYQFACGGFIKTFPLPDTAATVSSASFAQDSVQRYLRRAMENNTHLNQPRTFSLLKQLYKTCMNTKAIETNGLTTIKAILKDVGGWPVLEGVNWKEEHFNWIETTYTFRKLGLEINYLLSVDVAADQKNTSRRLIVLDQADLGLYREYLIHGLNSTIVKSYLEYMVGAAVVLGVHRDLAEEELIDSLNFEIELANISLSLEELGNVSSLYHPMNIKELQQKYPGITWRNYLQQVLLNAKNEIRDNDTVIVQVPQYIENLENLLARTPKRVQANYLLWRVIQFSIPYLTQKLNDEKLQFDKVLFGAAQKQERWKDCTYQLQNSMGIATGALYVRENFDKNSRTLVSQIITDIRSAFANILQEADWVDAETRAKALEKLYAISTYVGFADELFDDAKLDDFYSKLFLNSEDYLQSVLNIYLFTKNTSFAKLNQPVNKTEWTTKLSADVVNAQYVPAENSIQIPAGILQGTYFGEHKPQYLNYGSIGYIAGHELAHGFDDTGRHYDKDGNLINWWTEKANTAFYKKAECIIEQYGNITDPDVGMKINGVSTQGENIADNGGIREAYSAYNAWVERNGPELQLPGLKYSPHQLFWISGAISFCSKFQQEYRKQLILTDPHSPDRFRIIMPFGNTDFFAQDFNCPLGSGMNPVHKCKVW